MGIRAQGMVSADGRLTVEDVETVDTTISTGFALSVGTGDAPDVDRTWVDENGILTSGQGVGYDGPGIVSAPSGFTDYSGYPVIITRAGTGPASTFTTDFDFDASKPSPNGTIYVGPDGNNANDGLTYANRVRSLGTAITKANGLAVSVVRIRAKPGHYWRYNGSLLSDHFGGVLPTCDLIIEPDNENGGAGDVYVWGNHGAAVVWTQQGATPVYKSTSFGNSGTVINVVDRANVDEDGDPISLYRVTTVANPADPSGELGVWSAFYGRGAFYFNTAPATDEAWVQLFDDRATDANVVCLSAATAADQIKITNVAARRTWLDHIQIFGGAGSIEMTAGASAQHELYARQCVFNAAAGPANLALSAEHITGVLEDCRFSDAYSDGLNLHGDGDDDPAKAPHVLAIWCSGQRNGLSGSGANNTITAHEGAHILAVNCNFGSSADRPVHVIDASRMWMLGGSVAAPISTASGAGCVRAGSNGGDTAAIFLDAVDIAPVSGLQFSISAQVVGTKCVTRNMVRTGLVLDGNGDTGTY